MSRDSAAFWRQARRKLKDLPDPPNYLSEPAYANLLFFPHCHVRFNQLSGLVPWFSH